MTPAQGVEPDVLVIGGGPAGSSAAAWLARAGLRVLLIEREQFPREHIGESLLPATLALLDTLGVLPQVQAEGFTVKRGATMLWGMTDTPWSWHFAETNQRFPTSFQVWRPRFDQILLEHATACGVDVRHGNVLEVLFNDSAGAATAASGAVGVRLADDTRIYAGAVLDCSGQRAVLARQRGLIEFDSFFRNLALFSYFEGGSRLAPPDDGNIYIESYEHGWSWHIPLAFGAGGPGTAPWSSVGFVLDRERALPQLQAKGADALYALQRAATRNTRQMLEGARQVRPVSVLQDWSYRAREFCGDGWVLAGDAACFIDPLFSTGVHLAVTSGYLAAALLRTQSSDAELGAAARSSYSTLYGTQYEHFHRLAQLFYAGNRSVSSYFWAARRLMGDDERFAPREGFVRAVSGQAPAGYERSVLAQGDLPPAFVQAVELLQQGRARRHQHIAQRFPAGVAAGAPMRPMPVAGVSVARQAVLGDGCFEWSTVILAPGREAPLPCSALIAGMLSCANGQLGIAAIAARLLPDADEPTRARASAALQDAARILYIDGLLSAV